MKKPNSITRIEPGRKSHSDFIRNLVAKAVISFWVWRVIPTTAACKVLSLIKYYGGAAHG